MLPIKSMATLDLPDVKKPCYWFLPFGEPHEETGDKAGWGGSSLNCRHTGPHLGLLILTMHSTPLKSHKGVPSKKTERRYFRQVHS